MLSVSVAVLGELCVFLCLCAKSVNEFPPGTRSREDGGGGFVGWAGPFVSVVLLEGSCVCVCIHSARFGPVDFLLFDALQRGRGGIFRRLAGAVGFHGGAW